MRFAGTFLQGILLSYFNLKISSNFKSLGAKHSKSCYWRKVTSTQMCIKYKRMSIRMLVFSVSFLIWRIQVSQYTEWKKRRNPKAVSFAWVYVLFSFVSILSLLYNCKYEIIKSSLFPLVFLSGSSALKVSVYVSRHTSLWSA